MMFSFPIEISHISIIDTSLRGKSKLNQMCSYSSNLVLTRTTRTVDNVLFSTLPVRGSEQARPITWLVDLDSQKNLARATNCGAQRTGIKSSLFLRTATLTVHVEAEVRR